MEPVRRWRLLEFFLLHPYLNVLFAAGWVTFVSKRKVLVYLQFGREGSNSESQFFPELLELVSSVQG